MPPSRKIVAVGAYALHATAKFFDRTVETHRTTPLRKLRPQTQTDLVRFAIRKGLITA